MMIRYSDEFRKSFHQLPLRIQTLYRKQEEFLTMSSRDPRLHVKKLKGYDGVFSFRITRGYRALFSFADDHSIVLTAIGARKDIYDWVFALSSIAIHEDSCAVMLGWGVIGYGYMASLSLAVSKVAKKIHVEVDATRFERLADVFGFYHPNFLKELDAAERDVAAGRVRKISSFRDLQKK